MKKMSFLFLCMMGQIMNSQSIAEKQKEIATFAGGCFWCMEPPFEKLPGVINVVAGYMGGKGENPTYKNYAQKGYVEVVQLMYDPAKISYETLLDTFWRQIDPQMLEGNLVIVGHNTALLFFIIQKNKKKQRYNQKKN